MKDTIVRRTTGKETRCKDGDASARFEICRHQKSCSNNGASNIRTDDAGVGFDVIANITLEVIEWVDCN